MKFRLVILEGEGEIPRDVLGIGQTVAAVGRESEVKALAAPQGETALKSAAQVKNAPHHRRGDIRKKPPCDTRRGKDTSTAMVREILAKGALKTFEIREKLQEAGRPLSGPQVGMMLRAMERRGQLRLGDDHLWRLA